MERIALILGLADIICVTIVIMHLVTQRKEPIAKAFWIFFVITLPFFGLLCYLTFGVINVDRKMQKRIRRKLAVRTRFAADPGIQQQLKHYAADEHYRATVRCHELFERLSQRPAVSGNAVEMLISGQETYPRLLADIEAARHSVHIQSYILADDEFGQELGGLLASKARGGVEVRVLYDAIGSMHLSDSYVDFLAQAGVRVSPFGRINPIKRKFQINLRNHRKNAIIDGSIGYTGGLNLHAENSQRYCRQPRGYRSQLVHDYHFRVTGPVVAQLQEVFAEDWYAMTEEMLVEERYFPRLPTAGPVMARVITSGPGDDEQVIARVFFGAITSARKEIIIVTPYFYPDPAILEAIKNAALAGVAVHLILPLRSDHRIVSRAAYSLFPELADAGVHIYRRKLPFIHSKAMVIDRAWALVGSANLDYRSTRLNFELNLELADRVVVARLVRELHREMEQSKTVTAQKLRQWGFWHRFKNNLCALFAPIL